jgi:hypothetical protein
LFGLSPKFSTPVEKTVEIGAIWAFVEVFERFYAHFAQGTGRKRRQIGLC